MCISPGGRLLLSRRGAVQPSLNEARTWGRRGAGPRRLADAQPVPQALLAGRPGRWCAVGRTVGGRWPSARCDGGRGVVPRNPEAELLVVVRGGRLQLRVGAGARNRLATAHSLALGPDECPWYSFLVSGAASAGARVDWGAASHLSLMSSDEKSLSVQQTLSLHSFGILCEVQVTSELRLLVWLHCYKYVEFTNKNYTNIGYQRWKNKYHQDLIMILQMSGNAEEFLQSVHLCWRATVSHLRIHSATSWLKPLKQA